MHSNGYYCILLVRNGEKTIASSLSSIINQTEPPKKIVVVNDGSTDATAEYLEKFKNSKDVLVEIIETKSSTTDYSRIPKLLNMGINSGYEFFMFASHDCIFEKQYSEKILAEMRLDEKLVVVSGDFTKFKNVAPRGAGRFIRQSFFDRHFQKFPDSVSWESAITLKAIIEDYKIKNMHEARYEHKDQMGHDHHFVPWGKGMRDLGYYPPYALGRCCLEFLKGKGISKRGALNMLWGYISYSDTHKDKENDTLKKEFRVKIRNYQKKLVIKKLKKIFLKKHD